MASRRKRVNKTEMGNTISFEICVVVVSFLFSFFLLWLVLISLRDLELIVNYLNYMLQKHIVQFVVVLEKTFGLGRVPLNH